MMHGSECDIQIDEPRLKMSHEGRGGKRREMDGRQDGPRNANSWIRPLGSGVYRQCSVCQLAEG